LNTFCKRIPSTSDRSMSNFVTIFRNPWPFAKKIEIATFSPISRTDLQLATDLRIAKNFPMKVATIASPALKIAKIARKSLPFN